MIQPVGCDAAAVWLAEDCAPRCAPLPSSNLGPCGRCGGMREAGSTVAESLVALHRVGTHQIRRRWRAARAARSSTSRGSAEPLCGRIKGANREASAGKADVLPRSVFFLSSYEGQQGAANGQDSWGLFRDAQGFGRLDAGSCAGFTISTTMDLGISIFLVYVQSVALRNLDLLIKTYWSVICPLCC